jgi:hypothetical protein
MNDDQAKNVANDSTGSESRLVDAKTLIRLVWEEESRPSLRWLRQQQAERRIPFIKLGARVWFDPDEVRQWLRERYKVGTRWR